MFRSIRMLAATALTSATLFTGATAASAQEQDGLVNVVVGDVTVLENVGIGVAAQLVAQVCGLKVGPVAVLGVAVDRSGDSDVVCTITEPTQTQDVTITD